MAEKDYEDDIEIVELDEGKGDRVNDVERGRDRVRRVRRGLLVGIVVAVVVMGVVLWPTVESGVRVLRMGENPEGVGESEGTAMVKLTSEPVLRVVRPDADRENVYAYVDVYGGLQTGQQTMFVLGAEDGEQIRRETGNTGRFVWELQDVSILRGDDMLLFAVDKRERTLRWSSRVRGSVLFAEDRVLYVQTPGLTLVALNALNGEVLWENKEVFASTVLMDGEYFCVGTNEKVSVVRRQDGRVLWSKEGERCDAVQDGVVYTVGGENEVVRARGVADGREMWKMDVVASAQVPDSMYVQVVEEDALLFMLHFLKSDGVEGVEWGVIDARDGRVVWRTQENGSQRGGVVEHGDGMLYWQDGNEIRAIRVEDGEQVWSYQRTNVAVNNLVLWRGLLYVGFLDGSVLAMRGSDGKEVWRESFAGKGGMVSSWFYIDEYRDRMYVAVMDNLTMYALGLSDGREVWRKRLQV